jgi:hypothetical protein
VFGKQERIENEFKCGKNIKKGIISYTLSNKVISNQFHRQCNKKKRQKVLKRGVF